MRVHAHGCSRADAGTGLMQECATTVVATGGGSPMSPQKGQGSNSKAKQAVWEDRQGGTTWAFDDMPQRTRLVLLCARIASVHKGLCLGLQEAR